MGALRMLWKRKTIRVLKIRSLESIGTLKQDLNVGVIRVSASLLQELGSRNSLVRLSILKDGKASKSLVRIVRAATGKKALLRDEVALQYDDRQLLGVKRPGTLHSLSIRPVSNWAALPRFLLTHTSPLVRREAAFGLVLAVVGTIVGFILGALLSEQVWKLFGRN